MIQIRWIWHITLGSIDIAGYHIASTKSKQNKNELLISTDIAFQIAWI